MGAGATPYTNIMSAETETTITPGYHAALSAIAALGIEDRRQREDEFTTQEFAAALELSETAARRRLKKLLAEGSLTSRPGANGLFYRAAK